MKESTAKKIEERNILFDTAEECAEAAAPVFKERRWYWGKRTIPSQEMILRSLLSLQDSYLNHNPFKSPYVSSGRLIYYLGRFGYQNPDAKDF